MILNTSRTCVIVCRTTEFFLYVRTVIIVKVMHLNKFTLLVPRIAHMKKKKCEVNLMKFSFMCY